MGETVIVRVAQGSLRGKKVKTEAGATYYSFHAIPYAKPPVGPLRFKVSLIFLDIKATYRWISVLLCNCEWAGKRSRYRGRTVRGSNAGGGRDFPHLSRPALGPTQPPVQWVPGLSRG
jgi:hypothetical protein